MFYPTGVPVNLVFIFFWARLYRIALEMVSARYTIQICSQISKSEHVHSLKHAEHGCGLGNSPCPLEQEQEQELDPTTASLWAASPGLCIKSDEPSVPVDTDATWTHLLISIHVEQMIHYRLSLPLSLSLSLSFS